MTLSEDVLRDLLLEHGIEGVTLWQIRCFAAYYPFRRHVDWYSRVYTALARWESDELDFDAVWDEAHRLDNRRERAMANCDHSRVIREFQSTVVCLGLRDEDVPKKPKHRFCRRCGARLVDNAKTGKPNQLFQNSPRTPPPAAPEVVPHASTHSE